MELKGLIAHRGASAYAPENTLSAFERARDLGCQWVEFDVMASGNGELFVFHDERLERTTDGQGFLEHASSDYLESLDAGSWFSAQFSGVPIPTLKETMDWLVSNAMHANIELKPSEAKAEQTTTEFLMEMNRYWPKDQPMPLVSSFNLEVLKLCRSLSPEMPLGLLLDDWHSNCLRPADDYRCVSVHVNQSILTKKRVAEIKQSGYVACAYTVNRKSTAKKLLEWGVDALFTDYPDLLL